MSDSPEQIDTHRSHDLQKKIAQRLPGVVYQFRLYPDGRFCFPYASDRLYELFNIEPDAVRLDGSALFALIHPDDLPNVMLSIQTSAEQLTEWSQEIRVLLADGTERWIVGNSMPEAEADGSILWHGYISDITARKQMELAMQAQQRELKLIANSIPGPVSRVDTELRYLFVNDHYERIFGKPRAAFIGRTMPEVLGPVFAKLEGYTRRALSGETVIFENQGKMPSGEIIFGQTHYVPDLNEQQQVVGFFIIGIDITARKQAEAKLTEKTAFFEALVESSPDAILVVDHENRKVLQNSQMAKHWSIPDEVINDPSDIRQVQFVTQLTKNPQAFKERVQYLYQHHDLSSREEIELINGRTLDRVSAPIIDQQGVYYGRIWKFRDITRLKSIEQELKQHRDHLEDLVTARTAELQAANRAKSNFIANMNHELRTPMNAIMGMTELALNRASDDKQISFLKKSQQAAQHLLGIIDGILDFSQLEAGQLKLLERPLLVQLLLDESIRMLEAQAIEKSLVFKINLAPNVPQKVLGDSLRVKQILLNFLSNAVKFSQQGEIVLNIKLETNSHHKPLLRFEVIDQGIGLSEAQQEKLFKAFSQADDSATRHYGGTGLGLSISKYLAELMGGSVGVKSATNQGSTFWFTMLLKPVDSILLPIATSPVNELTQESASAFRGRKVLIVDDNRLNQEVSVLLLQEMGIECTTAASGIEAIAKVKQQTFDMVLMDIQMPEMDGIQASCAIRQLPKQVNLPIIAFSANTFEENQHACLAAGMNDFLAKPLRMDALSAVLEKWLVANKSLGDHAITSPLITDIEVTETLQMLREQKPEKFVQILQLFATHHQYDIQTIQDLLTVNNRSAAAHIAQSLKGATATLGNASMAALATQLEEAILSDATLSDCLDLNERCNALLSPLLQHIFSLV